MNLINSKAVFQGFNWRITPYPWVKRAFQFPFRKTCDSEWVFPGVVFHQILLVYYFLVAFTYLIDKSGIRTLTFFFRKRSVNIFILRIAIPLLLSTVELSGINSRILIYLVSVASRSSSIIDSSKLILTHKWF